MQELPVWLNPLELQLDANDTLTAEAIVRFMCGPETDSDTAAIRSRYQAIDQEQPALFAPPAEARILNQLIWPLRNAKASYLVGNYLATIALAGFVAEMTTVLVFEMIDNKSFNNRPWTDDDEEKLFGRSFELLEQSRRIEILKVYGLPEEFTLRLGRLRGTRRQHLHLAQQKDREQLARDARGMFRDAVYVVAAAIGQNVQDGKIVLTPQMMRYLKRVGTVPATKAPADVEKGGA